MIIDKNISGDIELTLEQVNDDVILYVAPVHGQFESDVRARVANIAGAGLYKDFLGPYGLDADDAVDPRGGANASGNYAVLMWPNTKAEKVTKQTATAPIAEPAKKVSLVDRIRLRQVGRWLANRPTDQYKGFMVGCIATTVILVAVSKCK